MKKLIVLMMLALPMSAIAQNVWEKPKEEKVEKAEEVKKPNKDEKYLRGAVPIVDGDVQWTLDVDVPGKSAQDIYDKMFKTLTDLTKSEGQLEGKLPLRLSTNRITSS